MSSKAGSDLAAVLRGQSLSIGCAIFSTVAARAIGVMAREPYCRSMLDRPSDEDVGRQILGVFMRHRIPATGTLQRNYFFEVRDSDFQRGINKAVANNWITVDLRNRYRYQLTTTGYAVGRMIHPVVEA